MLAPACTAPDKKGVIFRRLSYAADNSWGTRMNSGSSLRVKIAREPWEFEQIHELNHRTFAEEIPRHPKVASRRLVDGFHSENTYVIGLRGERLAGMMAIRGSRPFSLDQKLPNLDSYLPPGRSICELRLLAVDKSDRTSRLLPALLEYVWRHCRRQGYDLALISGITRQLPLYRHIGFVPFGPLVGTPEAQFQPMMLTLERFAPRVPRLFRSAAVARRAPSVNFLPGPVAIHEDVAEALQRPAESHRSASFAAELEATKGLLCGLTGAQQVEILLGSGTLANDAIAGQLSLQNGAGLILSNGEFGERLVDHARRFHLQFEVVSKPWGQAFDIDEIAGRLGGSLSATAWLWVVHCETSTGVLNDLDALRALCSVRGVKLCVDAISSIGTVPVDLEGTYLASGVSGKGLAAYPGLALVFHNHDVFPAQDALPRYLDLGLYARESGVPFTHSSNLVGALRTGLERTPWQSRFRELSETSAWLRAHLKSLGFDMVARKSAAPGVVTIALPVTVNSTAIGNELEKQGYLLSVNSGYLTERNWIQICIMGESSRDRLAAVCDALVQSCGNRFFTAAMPRC
jgi:aspartate aminotransferase-like enzyme